MSTFSVHSFSIGFVPKLSQVFLYRTISHFSPLHFYGTLKFHWICSKIAHVFLYRTILHFSPLLWHTQISVGFVQKCFKYFSVIKFFITSFYKYISQKPPILFFIRSTWVSWLLLTIPMCWHQTQLWNSPSHAVDLGSVRRCQFKTTWEMTCASSMHTTGRRPRGASRDDAIASRTCT